MTQDRISNVQTQKIRPATEKYGLDTPTSQSCPVDSHQILLDAFTSNVKPA